MLRPGAWGGGRHAPSVARGLAEDLASRGIASLRFQFPFMKGGSRRPDPPAVAHAAVRAAVTTAASLDPALPLIAGGRSFGGRMTSQAQALAPLPDVRALLFLGFPLHPAGHPSTDRGRHLAEASLPMLFVQAPATRSPTSRS